MALQVLNALLSCITAPSAPAASHALCSIIMQAMQPARLASLSAALARRLSDQLQSSQGISPAAHSLLLPRAQAAFQVASDCLQCALMHVHYALKSGPNAAAALPHGRTLDRIKQVLGDESGAEAAALWVNSSATRSLPVLLTANQWREQLLQAAQDVSAVSALPCIEGRQGFNRDLRVSLLLSLIQIAEVVPVRLAQWLDVAVGRTLCLSQVGADVTLGLTEAPEPVRAALVPSRQRVHALLNPSSSGSSGDGSHADGSSPTVSFVPATAAEFQAASEAAAGQACGPDLVGDATQAGTFQALWRWSESEIDDLIDFLYEECELDSRHAGLWPSGKLDVVAAIHAVAAATAS